MLVSIISVFHNREKYALESINSILNQTYRDIEIILVDDGSTDNTYKILSRISDPRIKLFKHKNQGFTKSIKEAINLSKGEIIAIHGAGDISLDTRIEKQVEILKRNTDIGIVGCYVENYDVDNNQRSLYIPPSEKNGNMTEILKKANIFTHGEVAFRRDIYEKVGGYREYFKYSQDRDLWLRMSLLTNYTIIPEKLYIRYNFSNGVSKTFEKMVIQKYYGSLMCQCIEMRVIGKKDLIDLYGEHAAFFRSRDRDLSAKFLKWSLKELVSNRMDESNYLVNLSINEYKTVFNIIIKELIVICTKNRIIRGWIINIINVLRSNYRVHI